MTTEEMVHAGLFLLAVRCNDKREEIAWYERFFGVHQWDARRANSISEFVVMLEEVGYEQCKL